MILCKSCGYEGVYEGRKCAQCGAEFSLSAEEILQLEDERRIAIRDGAHETATELTHILADAGHPAAAAMYGRMLYEGSGVREDAAAAMEYLSLSAREGDAKGAFFYGKVLKKQGNEQGKFFLLYSALLGYGEAYDAAATIFQDAGQEADAIAYLGLAAASGSRRAAASLAVRYDRGAGVAPDEGIAKWYLLHAAPLPPNVWPLAFRLRNVQAKEPPAPTVPHLSALIREMMERADKCGYQKAYLNLCQMLATRGDEQAQCRLGLLYIQGYLGAPDAEKGKDVLLYYGKKGNAAAYLALADAYRFGAGMPLSRMDAIAWYNAAKALGSAEACIRLGDLYSENDRGQNIPYAYALYREALSLGSREGADKARAIEERREELFARGKKQYTDAPEDAFSSFALAASMGYAPASVMLGFCYEEGIGVSVDRRRAFLWYESAAKEKEAMAEYRLGRCYLHGIGINRNFKAAHMYLRRAAAAGVEEAREALFALLARRGQKLLSSLYSMGMRLLYQGKYAAARTAMERAAALGHARALYTLGALHEFGIGGKADRDLAYSTYRAAAEKGFVDSRAAYKSVLLKMFHAKRAEGALV
jgi:TPR repeat protein